MIINKERLLCKGYAQVEGIDFEEKFSPIARLEAIRMFMIFASFQNFKVYQMDVKLSFLNVNLEEEVYIEKLEGLLMLENKDYVCRLKKSLYGLKELKNIDIIYLIGFRRGVVDISLYIRT